MKISCKNFIIGEIIGVILLLMLFDFLSSSMVQKSFPEMSGFWSMVTAISTTGAFLAASVAAGYAYKTWSLEKLPVVHAIGSFIISKETESNQIRDRAIFKTDSVHTFQMVNVGRGSAKKVIPSVKRGTSGRLLEEVNPYSFSLPANKGTKEFGEILQVHGQRFVRSDEYELEFEDNRCQKSIKINRRDYTERRKMCRWRLID